MGVIEFLILDFQVLGIFVFDFPIQVVATVYLYTLVLTMVDKLLNQTGLYKF